MPALQVLLPETCYYFAFVDLPHKQIDTLTPWRFAAGLYAAHVLQKEHNIPVELVEAADYVGGRVKQVRTLLCFCLRTLLIILFYSKIKYYSIHKK